MTNKNTVDVSAKNSSIDIDGILHLLPHRYPFLLVDRVIDCVPGEHLAAIKNITANEPFFPGHFPKKMIMPGVLMLEALAQATGLLTFITLGEAPHEDELYYLVGIDNAKFKRPVGPGDQLVLKVTVVRRFRNIWKFSGIMEVDGVVVASADITCARGQG